MVSAALICSPHWFPVKVTACNPFAERGFLAGGCESPFIYSAQFFFLSFLENSGWWGDNNGNKLLQLDKFLTVAPNTLSKVIKSGQISTGTVQSRRSLRIPGFHQAGIQERKTKEGRRWELDSTVFGRDFLRVKKKD